MLFLLSKSYQRKTTHIHYEGVQFSFLSTTHHHNLRTAYVCIVSWLGLRLLNRLSIARLFLHAQRYKNLIINNCHILKNTQECVVKHKIASNTKDELYDRIQREDVFLF